MLVAQGKLTNARRTRKIKGKNKNQTKIIVLGDHKIENYRKLKTTYQNQN